MRQQGCGPRLVGLNKHKHMGGGLHQNNMRTRNCWQRQQASRCITHLRASCTASQLLTAVSKKPSVATISTPGGVEPGKSAAGEAAALPVAAAWWVLAGSQGSSTLTMSGVWISPQRVASASKQANTGADSAARQPSKQRRVTENRYRNSLTRVAKCSAGGQARAPIRVAAAQAEGPPQAALPVT
jgi:hypothetical protein